MRISLLQISLLQITLLRFLKKVHDFALCKFMPYTLSYFISLVQFFWLFLPNLANANFFLESKVALGNNPLYCSKMTSFQPSEGVSEIIFGSIGSRSLWPRARARFVAFVSG